MKVHILEANLSVFDRNAIVVVKTPQGSIPVEYLEYDAVNGLVILHLDEEETDG